MRSNPFLHPIALGLAFLLQPTLAEFANAQTNTNHWWPDTVEKALAQCGPNRLNMEAALDQTPEELREDVQFLFENMPEQDLQSLSGRFVLDDARLAHESFAAAPWHEKVSRDIYLDNILPYACANETRERWRKVLREKCLPLIAGCKTPGEAAQKLNEQIWKLTNVKYSTARKKADQSPSETMESGLASCTGLSILLIDACRSVGVPARLAGTPMWMNMRGNHTWVEVWDDGWHFTGAAEPDAKGLDHAWFEHDASEAQKDSTQHAIYAASFKKTGISFPLDWAPDIHWINAINVTDRYTPKVAAAAPDPNKVHLMVKVLDHLAGQRVEAKVSVTNIADGSVRFEGVSKGESADMNAFLAFDVPRGATYDIHAELGGQEAGREFTAGTNSQAVVVVSLSDTPVFKFPSQACYAPPPVSHNLKPLDEEKLKAALTEFFAAPADKQAKWKFPRSLDKLLRENEPAVRHVAWQAYAAAPIHEDMKSDFVVHQVKFQNYLSPFTVRSVGERPEKGWAMFIAMHGGGGTAKEVNDSQWQIMQHYYKDHPEAGGYLYVALRAPNDTWNGFYDDYVYPLVANLIHEFLLFGDVNPNKVFIMGYSHGGYGAFAIGPKEPDLFAAIHASAGAPTDGETTGVTLRNTIFTCMVGENDTAYGRIERDRKFKDTMAQLRGTQPDIYPVTVQIIPGNGHTGLPDRDKIKEMYPAVRNPAPHELTWLMTDGVIKDFFWLHTDAPGKQHEIDASCYGNNLSVTVTTNVTSATIYLDARLIDYDRPITMELNGEPAAFDDKKTSHKVQPSLRILCKTLLNRGDPELAFTTEITLSPNTKSQK